MFNALTSAELLRGVGNVLRQLAAKAGPLEEYERGQALSAYSVTRLLAAEQAAAPALLRATQREMLELLGSADASEISIGGPREAIRAAQTATELGDALAELLAIIPRDSAIRSGVHAALADMVDREVEALAAAGR